MVKQQQQGDTTRLLLTPNRSLGWRGNVLILSSVVVLSLIIVTGMILAGAWPVLPFAGLELIALTVAHYYTARQCQRQEVLVISGDTLRLEKGLYRKQAQWELPRRYTRVRLEHSRHPWTPPRLYLMHRETEVALAPFLNIDDTRALLAELDKAGLGACRT